MFRFPKKSRTIGRRFLAAFALPIWVLVCIGTGAPGTAASLREARSAPETENVPSASLAQLAPQIDWRRTTPGKYTLHVDANRPWGLPPWRTPWTETLWARGNESEGSKPRPRIGSSNVRSIRGRALMGPGRFLLPGQTAARAARSGLVYDSRRPSFDPGFHQAVLSPTWMARRYWRMSKGNTPVDSWLSISKAPTGSGSLLFADGLLNVKRPEWVPAGTVKPRFVEGWNANVSYRWHMSALSFRPALRGSVGFSDNLRWGYELGVESKYFNVSFFDEMPYPGRTDADGYHYLDKLVQAEAMLPLRFVTPYLGIKSHWKEKDLWLRSGFRFPTSKRTSLDLGTDIFAGPVGSYFGGWAGSDRGFLVFTLKL